MKYFMNHRIWIYLLSSIDPVFAFLGNNYKVTTDHSTFIPYVVSLILLEEEVQNLYFQIGQLKRSEKGLLLIWHCCHEQNLMGLFSSVSIEKTFFFFLLSRLLEVTTSWHQFRLAVWHCSFGLLLSFSLPIPTKEI